MRLVGTLSEESQARCFADYLRGQEIPSEVRVTSGGWSVWVHREDQLPNALHEFGLFRANPADSKWAASVLSTSSLRLKAVAAQTEAARTGKVLSRKLRSFLPLERPIVFCLIFICILVALLTRLGLDEARLNRFYFSPVEYQTVSQDVEAGVTRVGNVPRSAGLEPILHGQVWRLLTPMFIHYGWPHLIFNMIALSWFGGLIESRKGSWVLLGLVLAAAPVSFYCQYLWDLETLGPDAISLPGGMSGVIYALFGYVWMMGEYDPESGLQLSGSTVVWMLLWLMLCFTGRLGPIANAAHFSGLVLGMLVALAPYLIGSRDARGTDSG